MNPDLDPDERVYEEVMSVESMYQVAEQSLVEYNNQSKNRMNLVIFGSDLLNVVQSAWRRHGHGLG